MMMRVWSAVLLTVGVVCAVSTTDETPYPIIGILTLPEEQCDSLMMPMGPSSPDVLSTDIGSCFTSFYTQWLTASGARVAPIRYDLSPTELKELFNSLNGVLFTGGGLNIVDPVPGSPDAKYMQTASQLLNMTIAAGDVPLWATCMGFQVLHVLVGGPTALKSDAFDSENLPLALDVTSAFASSMFYSGVSSTTRTTLATQPVTENLHHDGVPPEAYSRLPALADFFDILSTNVDRKNATFVSTVEAKSARVFASQWHPERNGFEWNPTLNINHSPAAVAAMQDVSMRFVALARQNSHAFLSQSEEAAALIYNYIPVSPGNNSYQLYHFPAAAQ